FQLKKDQKNLLLKYTNNHLTYVAQSFSLPLSVCVQVFFFCKTSVKIGYFGLAPLASVNSVYLALWCVFRLGMGIRLNCLNRSSGGFTIDFRLIINIFILKFTIYRLYYNAVKISR